MNKVFGVLAVMILGGFTMDALRVLYVEDIDTYGFGVLIVLPSIIWLGRTVFKAD